MYRQFHNFLPKSSGHIQCVYVQNYELGVSSEGKDLKHRIIEGNLKAILSNYTNYKPAFKFDRLKNKICLINLFLTTF